MAYRREHYGRMHDYDYPVREARRGYDDERSERERRRSAWQSRSPRQGVRWSDFDPSAGRFPDWGIEPHYGRGYPDHEGDYYTSEFGAGRGYGREGPVGWSERYWGADPLADEWPDRPMGGARSAGAFYYPGAYAAVRPDLPRRTPAGGYRGYYGGQDVERYRGRHIGRGPRGYYRSDDRICEDVCDVLTWNGEIDASEMEVKVEGGRVTLTGIVEDRREKRLAEDLAEDVLGVDDVQNDLKVRHGFLATITGEKADETDRIEGDRIRERQERVGAVARPAGTTATGASAH